MEAVSATWHLWRRGSSLYIAPNAPWWFHGAQLLAAGSIEAVLAAKRLHGEFALHD